MTKHTELDIEDLRDRPVQLTEEMVEALTSLDCWDDVAASAVLGADLEDAISIFSAGSRVRWLLQEIVQCLHHNDDDNKAGTS